MELEILKCGIGKLKVKVKEFKIQISKYEFLDYREECIQSILYLNNDSIISYNKDLLINKNKIYFK